MKKQNRLKKVLSDSRYREKIIEHIFISELMQAMARRGKKIELLRTDTDMFGYDLMVKWKKRFKYIQLKGKTKKGGAVKFNIHQSLIKNDDGTIILILIDDNDVNLKLRYRIFNRSKKKEVLSSPPIRKKKDKEKYCCIAIGKFEPETDIDNIAKKLFDLSR